MRIGLAAGRIPGHRRQFADDLGRISMRLSHTRKALVISGLLIMTALLGQAAAATTIGPQTAASSQAASSTPPEGIPSTAPSARAAPSALPGDSAGTPGDPSTAPGADRTESTTAPGGKHVKTGPAGSRLVTGTKGVALTFDDGPDPDYTPALLKILKKENVKATFCLVGSNAKQFPDLVRAIVADGHALCNHTWNHDLRIGKKSAAKIKADLERTNAAIRAAVPGVAIPTFRAPGGNFTPKLVKGAKQLGMSSIYWKVDPRDWDHSHGESHGAHTAKIISYVKKRTRDGAIVLSHDYAQPDTIKAYRTLIPWLHDRFELVPLTS
ncbi:polysaccharide deacetylase family protein [Actinoplanes sp. NBRC 101535]|uniref:polysaccharide deacetylase family protein n=1 Tax=Actinoplanes sp. NBRC 101535 TaxID=3032196 RepID=UPI00255685BE|nr:polysaccharide deacetylase family protein [Actinoplanes sp. NBRC 101535]